MFKRISNVIGKLVTWSLWRSIKKRIRPLDSVTQFVPPHKIPNAMRLLTDQLRTGKYAGIILLSDNKRIYNYIKKSLNGINTAFIRVPYLYDTRKLFAKVKENANVSHVDFSVTGYENDTPFIVMVVPKDRPRTNNSNQKQTNHKRSK